MLLLTRLLCLAIISPFLGDSLAGAQEPSGAAQQVFPDAAVNRTVHLQGEKISLPLVLVKGFPFLEGEINGISGKLLFDIGEEASFALNSHRVSPSNGKEIGKGHFGSGQTFTVYRFPIVHALKLEGGPQYTSIPEVRGNPGLPLEQHITSDFIGWMGLAWFDGYILKLTYLNPSVTFYKDDRRLDGVSSGMSAALKHETVVQTIRFNSSGHRNIPTVSVRIGSHDFLATFDTGSHDVLWLKPELRDQLKAEDLLSERETGTLTLAQVEIGGRLIELHSHAEIESGEPGVAKELGSPTEPVITLGYEFLSQYKTVWNYRDQTLTLLRR